jgi:hypothetical protein
MLSRFAENPRSVAEITSFADALAAVFSRYDAVIAWAG